MQILRFLIDEAPYKALSILVLSVIAGLSEVAAVLLTINGVQEVSAGRHYGFYLVSLPIAGVSFVLSKRFSQAQAATLTEKILEKLYTGIADDVRQAELPELEQYNTSEIPQNMLKAQAVTDAVTKGVHAAQSLIAIMFLWLYVFQQAPFAGVFSLLVFTFAAAVYDVFQRLAIPDVHEEAAHERELTEVFSHLFDGAKEIRIDQRKNDDIFINRLTPLISSVKQTRIRMLFYFSRYWTFVAACFLITLASVAFFFPALYSNTTAFELLIIGFYVWTPLLTIVGTLPLITQGTAALESLYRLYHETRMTPQRSGPLAEPSEETLHRVTELMLEDVRFTYDHSGGASGFSAGPVSFTVRAGETLFITGGNGSGKTTVMKLLTGLYHPSSGVIRINGAPVDMTRCRNLFATVFSDFHLFDALYGVEKIDEQTVQTLLKQTGLHRKTRWLAHEKRFSTTHLSAGQRKRLALVVALLEDKPVYVFDEWTADQDPHFRKYFYETLLPSLQQQGKLIIVVSHDDRYFHIADHHIRLEYGQMLSPTVPIADWRALPAEHTVPRRQRRPEAHTEQERSRTSSSDPEDAITPSKRPKHRISDLFHVSVEDAIRPLFWNLLVSVIGPPITTAILFTVVTLPSGVSETRLFVLFLLTLMVNLISNQRFSNSLIMLIEDRIAGIRLTITEHIRQTSLYTFEKTGSDTIRTALTYDMQSVSDLSSAIAFSVSSFFIFTGFLVFMATLSLPALLITLGVMSGGGLLFVYNQVRIRQIVHQVREEETSLFEAVTDLLDGFKELKLNTRKSHAFFQQCFRTRAARLRGVKILAANRFIDIYTLAAGMWQSLFLMAVLALPMTGLLTGNPLFTFVGLLVCMPIGTFADQIPRITLSSISMQRLYELGEKLDRLKPEQKARGRETTLVCFNEIRYEQIAFEYQDESDHPFAVGPLSLTFHAGEIVFITGGNGSGKSTLVNMLTGLYPAWSGTVFLNGEETEIVRCRSLFSAIFYDFHLFDQLYGLEDVDANHVNDLLRLMQLDDSVQFDGDRFSTLDLSTGQRKRLAMIVTMLEDKPIYLFDEWAADQDPQFRRYFYETLLPEFKAQGKTVIAVTHDDRWFHVADRVLKMEYGQLAT